MLYYTFFISKKFIYNFCIYFIGVKKMVKLCRHFKSFSQNIHEELVMSDGHPWNGWHTAYLNGKLIYSSFETGKYWEYIQHLLQNEECREKTGINKEELEELAKKIEEEWRQVTDP